MPKILPVVKNPAPILRQRARPVALTELAAEEMQTLIDDMVATMWQADGVGIAAPQVGRGLRIAIVTNGHEARPLINPVITARSFRKETMDEGCLSVPGFYGPVKRAVRIHVKAYDRRGSPVSFIAENFAARVVQHEVDHLNGVLFIDRARQVTPTEPAAKL